MKHLLILMSLTLSLSANAAYVTTAIIDWSTLEMRTTGDLVVRVREWTYIYLYTSPFERVSSSDWNSELILEKSFPFSLARGYADENTVSATITQENLGSESVSVWSIRGVHFDWVSGSGSIITTVDYYIESDGADVASVRINKSNRSYQSHSIGHHESGIMTGVLSSSSFMSVQNRSDGVSFYARATPVPAAAWLFSSALIGLASIKRKQLTINNLT